MTSSQDSDNIVKALETIFKQFPATIEPSINPNTNSIGFPGLNKIFIFDANNAKYLGSIDSPSEHLGQVNEMHISHPIDLIGKIFQNNVLSLPEQSSNVLFKKFNR